MTGELFHKLITENGKRIVYIKDKRESYLYEIACYVIELYSDWYTDYKIGIRVFALESNNKYELLHHIKGGDEKVSCDKLFKVLNETSNLYDSIKNTGKI